MTSDVDEATGPVDDVTYLPSGASQVCAVFDYEGMVDGTIWDALWFYEGELAEISSFIEAEWIGGPEGSWWVCATGDVDGVPDGLYELQLNIQAEVMADDTIRVGGPLPVDFTVVNDTPSGVCYLYITPTVALGWGTDDLGSEQTIAPGEEVVLQLPPDRYDFRTTDCDREIGPEVFEIDIVGGERVLLSGG
jgi:hypothetical protein